MLRKWGMLLFLTKLKEHLNPKNWILKSYAKKKSLRNLKQFIKWMTLKVLSQR